MSNAVDDLQFSRIREMASTAFTERRWREAEPLYTRLVAMLLEAGRTEMAAHMKCDLLVALIHNQKVEQAIQCTIELEEPAKADPRMLAWIRSKALHLIRDWQPSWPVIERRLQQFREIVTGGHPQLGETQYHLETAWALSDRGCHAEAATAAERAWSTWSKQRTASHRHVIASLAAGARLEVYDIDGATQWLKALEHEGETNCSGWREEVARLRSDIALFKGQAEEALQWVEERQWVLSSQMDWPSRRAGAVQQVIDCRLSLDRWGDPLLSEHPVQKDVWAMFGHRRSMRARYADLLKLADVRLAGLRWAVGAAARSDKYFDPQLGETLVRPALAPQAIRDRARKARRSYLTALVLGKRLDGAYEYASRVPEISRRLERVEGLVRLAGAAA